LIPQRTPINGILVILALLAFPASAIQAASGDVPVSADLQGPFLPPLPVWPSDQEAITLRKPIFLFNGRHGATRYRIELARDPSFAEPVTLEQFTVLEPGGIAPAVATAYLGEPLADGQYCWRVFAGNDEGYWTPPANYRLFAVVAEGQERVSGSRQPVHPRLLLTADDIGRFRARVDRSEHLRRGWQYLVNATMSVYEADPLDEAYARSGSGQHGYYSNAAAWYHRHLGNLAFVAMVTENQRLKEKGVQMLLTACSYERWLGPSFDNPEVFNPPWHSALETAMMTEAVATAYDLLHASLTEEQRSTVRAALVEKGVRPLIHDWVDPVTAARLPRHQLPTGNWVMVCTGGAGVGALVLHGEHEEAAEWLRLCRNRVRAWLLDRGGDYYVDNPWKPGRPDPIPVIGPSEPNFGPDGGYKESIGYMDYAMRYVSFFADGLRRETRENLFADVPLRLLEPLAWSILNYPDGAGVRSAIVDFGDCGPLSRYLELYTALIKHRDDGRAAWLYRHIVPAPTTPRALLWYADVVADAAPENQVPVRAFRGIGQALMRTAWSPNAPVAAIKFHQNRGHLDIGAWFLFSGGQPALIDSGVTPYGGSIYGTYSSQSIAHNVVLVDNQPQTRADGKMLTAFGTSMMAVAAGELAAAYPDRLTSWRRDLVFLPGGLVAVHDRLAGKGPRQFDLLLHPGKPFAAEGQDTFTVGSGPSATSITVHCDAPLTMTQQDGYSRNEPRKYLRFAGGEPAEARAFLTVCRCPSGSHGRVLPVQVEPAGPGRWRIDVRDGASSLSARWGGGGDHRLRTDARFAAVWEEERRRPARHALMLGGTGLVADQRIVFAASRPVDAALEWESVFRATIRAEDPVEIAIDADHPYRRWYLNGKPVESQSRSGGARLNLEPGEHQVEAGDFNRPLGRLAPLVFDDLLAVPAVNAPAFRPGVSTRDSAGWSEGLAAIDGDINTAWVSRPGVSLPQWLEVQLPQAESIAEVSIETGLPSAGRVELWEETSQSWRAVGPFETTYDQPAATVKSEAVETRRLRVSVERVEAPASSAVIYSLEWKSASALARSAVSSPAER
jgi:hypothetical protein